MIWSTPQPIFDALNREFHFSVDLCADADNAKCPIYFPREVSLSLNWELDGVPGIGFLNPPYGKEITNWVAKAANTNRVIVGFLPGRTNAPWWHEYVMMASQIRFVKRKVSFANGNGCKGVPPWGAVVAVWGLRGSEHFVEARSWDWRTE